MSDQANPYDATFTLRVRSQSPLTAETTTKLEKRLDEALRGFRDHISGDIFVQLFEANDTPPRRGEASIYYELTKAP